MAYGLYMSIFRCIPSTGSHFHTNNILCAFVPLVFCSISNKICCCLDFADINNPDWIHMISLIVNSPKSFSTGVNCERLNTGENEKHISNELLRRSYGCDTSDSVMVIFGNQWCYNYGRKQVITYCFTIVTGMEFKWGRANCWKLCLTCPTIAVLHFMTYVTHLQRYIWWKDVTKMCIINKGNQNMKTLKWTVNNYF